MAQYGLPDSDIDHGQWSEVVGDGNATHFEEIDEGFGPGRGSGSGPDDSTTYWMQDDMNNYQDIYSTLSVVTDPLTGSGHFLRGRHRKHTSGGRQVELIFRMLQGSGIVIVTATFTNISEIWTTETLTLTTTEADAISDYTNLRAQAFAKGIGGGNPRKTNASAHEFECPDVAGGGGGFAYSQGVIVG